MRAGPRPSCCALLAAGCAAIDAPPGPSVGSLAPAAAPQTTGGALVSPERKRLIDAFGGEYSAPAAERYLNEILARLAPASETPTEPYRVTILDLPVVNAFALPSGDIFVTRGLLALANDGSEVAAVMAHEIAHVTARHAAQRAELEKTAALFTRVSSQVLDRPQEGEEVEARMKLSIARFSRQQEFEADKIGIGVIAKAGYDPYAASRFLTSLGRWSALRASLIGLGAADKPDMMATHPSTPERVAQAIVEARQVRRAGRRRNRSRRLFERDRRHRLWRRPGAGAGARRPLPSSQTGLRLRGAGRLRAGEPVDGADRRRRRRRAGAAARQHRAPPIPPHWRARSPRAGSTA